MKIEYVCCAENESEMQIKYRQCAADGARWRWRRGRRQAAGGDIRLIRRKQVPAVDGRHTRLTPLGTVAQMQIQMYLTSVCASYLTRLSVPPSACAAHVPRSTHMSLLLVLLLLLLLLLMTPAKSSISRD